MSELRSRVAGAWAAAAWLSLSPVQACSYQVRPDPLMVACLAFSLWLLLRRGNGSAFLSGLCWAVGFAFLQKAVLFLPVLALVLVRELWVAPPSGRRAVLRRVGFCALGASVPIAVGALALAAMQAGGAWWQWAVLFNRTTPPLEGTWFLRGLWPWRKAILQTNTLAFLLAAGAAIWIAWRGRSLERWILLSGTAILLCLQMLPRRPYYVYSLPSSLALAGLVGIGLALSLERVRGERRRLLLGLGLAAALAAPTLPAFLRAWEARGELDYQAARSRHVLERMGPSDVLFQGYPPFAIQARDAGFLGWMPLEMGLRAHSVGLDCGPDAATVLRTRRPAFVGLGTAHLPLREERARLAAILTEELGYVWNQRWQLYEREEWITAERLDPLGGAPGSVRVPAR